MRLTWIAPEPWLLATWRAAQNIQSSYPCPFPVPVVGKWFLKVLTKYHASTWQHVFKPEERRRHIRSNIRFSIRFPFPVTGSKRSGSRLEATGLWFKESRPQRWDGPKKSNVMLLWSSLHWLYSALKLFFFVQWSICHQFHTVATVELISKINLQEQDQT